MKFLTVIGFLFVVLDPLTVSAQMLNSLYQLEEVVIEGNRLKNFTSGNKIQSIDSATLQNYSSFNLSDLLSQQSQIFIKSYGPGNLATVSTRGTNASHTAVLWNGFNLQGPSLGQFDFSLFPVSFADEVDIQYGGAGALFGSGAVGGAVHLNSPAKFDKGVTAFAAGNAGSFSTFHQRLNIGLSKKRVTSSLKFFNYHALNDFTFINREQDGNKVRQQNAAVRQTGVLQENHFRLNDREQLNLRIWIQDNHREVPSSMLSGVSNASLSSRFYRITSEWKRMGEHITWFVRSAYFNERMNYNDPLSSICSITSYQTSITEAESRIHLGKNQLLNLGVNNTYNYATSENYQKSPRQNRTALFACYKHSNAANSWKGILSLREELVDGKPVPFTPSAGWEGRVVKGITLKGNFSRNYRVPTFNDLYWYPGGNPDLKPESGWSEEITISGDKKFKSGKSLLSFTLFNSNVKNWILWLPSVAYWTPQNIQSVWSRGLESTFNAEKRSGEWSFKLSALYSYVISTNETKGLVNDQSIHKQLIYVPLYSAQGQASIGYKSFYLAYAHTYTGNRFTSADNTSYIPGYQLGNIIMTKTFVGRQFRGTLTARINNVWNTSYQVVLQQAMPLRYFEFGASIYFNKPNH